jgi:hypothetical protein
MDRHGLDNDHRCAAHRAFGVIRHMALGGQAFHRHVGRMGAKDDAVPQGVRAYSQWREQAGESIGHDFTIQRVALQALRRV